MAKPLSRKHAEVYESDDGFVEDAPNSKKRKSESKPKQSTSTNEGDDQIWELSARRRVQVSNFKGNTMVDIREFYEKDDKMLPGKKGIAMTLDQYSALIKVLPEIERVLKAQGATVPRPRYGQVTEDEAEDEESQRDRDEDDEEARSGDGDSRTVPSEDAAPSNEQSKLEKFRMKKNHEATSDEDNG